MSGVKSVLQEDDFLKIQKAISQNNSVEFSCYTLTPQQKERFLQILHYFLTECAHEDLFNCLSYCLLELLDNASKANAKRIYFQKHNLDINNAADYETGMKDFKNNLSENNSDYFDELNKGFLQVTLHLSSDDNIVVKVTNNTTIAKKEYNRILEKIKLTDKYDSMQEAITEIDVTEGAGLGIVSIILMLKSLGLDKENLKFDINENQTEATIQIPADIYGELESL